MHVYLQILSRCSFQQNSSVVISVLALGYHRILDRHDAVECGLLERNLEKERQHPSRADLLAAWERHDFGAQITRFSDGGAHARYKHLPLFGGEDGGNEKVAHRAKTPADQAVKARLLWCPFAQVHASFWHLVSIVYTFGDFLVELLFSAPRKAGWNVDNGNRHDSSSFAYWIPSPLHKKQRQS